MSPKITEVLFQIAENDLVDDNDILEDIAPVQINDDPTLSFEDDSSFLGGDESASDLNQSTSVTQGKIMIFIY